MKLTNDAAEKWAANVMGRCNTPLTEIQANYLVSVFMNEQEMEEDEKLKELCTDPSKGGLVCMAMNRCKSAGIELTRTAALFLGLILNSPGEVTMTAAYIKYKLREVVQNGKVNVGFLSTRCFPMGIPSEKDWQELWDMQKLDLEDLKLMRQQSQFAPDNVLDYVSSYQTLS